VAELATGHTGTETVVADTDAFILKSVGKVIVTLGHGTDEDGNTLVGFQRLQVVPGANQGCLKTHSHLTAVGRQVVGDGVLDDLEELLLRVGGADGETVEQLDHETGETLEGSGDADGGVDFDQNSLGCVDENLEPTGLVDRRVKKSQKTLRWVSGYSFFIYSCFLFQAMLNRTWWVISGRASLISRFILRMIPMCSSLFSRENFSSLVPPRPLETAL